MTVLPPSPFLTSAEIRSAEPAVASSPSPGVATVGPIAESSSSTGGHQGRPAVPQPLPNYATAGPTDDICEIFNGARKLDDQRFVLDERAFLEAIEPMPLFLQRET